MANGWTPQRRVRQAQQIRNWRPWEKSTGPRSDEGKASSARNATRHGMRSGDNMEAMRELKGYLRRCRRDSQAGGR